MEEWFQKKKGSGVTDLCSDGLTVYVKAGVWTLVCEVRCCSGWASAARIAELKASATRPRGRRILPGLLLACVVQDRSNAGGEVHPGHDVRHAFAPSNRECRACPADAAASERKASITRRRSS